MGGTVGAYPNPPCQHSLWGGNRNTRRKPTTSVERGLTQLSRVLSGNRTHDLRCERRLRDSSTVPQIGRPLRVRTKRRKSPWECFKGKWQYIFLLSQMEELVKLYNNFF